MSFGVDVKTCFNGVFADAEKYNKNIHYMFMGCGSEENYGTEKMAAEVEGILLWAFEGLQRLVKNGFQFTESDRAKRNRELVKRDNNNVFDFLESEGYIRLKADACTSSKELYEVYRMWCEENSLNAIKARGFSDALIANQRRYNLESTNNIVNSSGRRVRGFVGIEALVQPDLTPNGWRA